MLRYIKTYKHNMIFFVSSLHIFVYWKFRSMIKFCKAKWTLLAPLKELKNMRQREVAILLRARWEKWLSRMQTAMKMWCILNQPCYFEYLGVPKTMNSPVLVKLLEISAKKKVMSQCTNPNTLPNSAKIRMFGKLWPKGNSIADIGKIGGNKKKSQDVTYAYAH